MAHAKNEASRSKNVIYRELMPAHQMENLYRVTEVQLVYKNKLKVSDRPRIRSSLDAYKLFSEAWDYDKIELQEEFKILLLDRKNSCLGISQVATGGITDCMVDLRIVFATAIKARATAIILAHNHPSGNKTFSEPDRKLTKDFADAGKILNVNVLDHVVLTTEGYISMADEGVMPSTRI